MTRRRSRHRIRLYRCPAGRGPRLEHWTERCECRFYRLRIGHSRYTLVLPEWSWP